MAGAARSVEPRRKPTQRRATQTRARILEAAAHVFAQRGYAGGTTNHFAAEAGISIGSLYQYFPNKDSILVELCREHARSGLTAFEARLAEARPGVEAMLHVVVAATLDNHAGDPRFHQVIFEEAPRPAALLAELHRGEQRVLAMAAGLLAADRAVLVPDVDLAARIVVTTIESLVHRFVARDGATLDRDAFAAEVVAMLHGYLTHRREQCS